MADAGGGKTKPLPVTGRERATAYDDETKYKLLQKEFEAYKLKCDPDTVKNVSVRLDLPLSGRFPADILAKIDTLNADHEELQLLKPQLASIPALQASSDILDAVITNLSAGSKLKTEIPTIVSQLVAGNGLLRNNAVSDTATLASRDAEIARLTQLNQTLDRELQEAKVQKGVAEGSAGRKDDKILELTADIEELNKRVGPAASSDATIQRLDAELVEERLNLERQQNESIALQVRITSLDKELAHEKNQKDAFADQAVELTEQIDTTNGEMAGTLALLGDQEKLVADERKKTQKLTAYIMELGGMIAEVPDILSAGWLMKPLLKISLMSERPTLFNFDGLDADNLKLIQGHLQKFDMAMLALYKHQKKNLLELAELELDNKAQTSAVQVKDDMINDYAAYQTVLSYGIIDMADHLKWTMAGLKANSPIRRPELVAGERWHAGKKQILDLVIQFEGELVKVSEQRTLNIENAKEIARLKAPPTFTPLTPADVANPLLHDEIDELKVELRSQRSENVECQRKMQVLDMEIVTLKNDARSAGRARTTKRHSSESEDDTPPETPRTRTSDTVDSVKLRGLLIQLQHLLGPDFGGANYFDIDRLTWDVIDVFKRDIPMAYHKVFILALNKHASVDDTTEISDTSFSYNLYSFLIGRIPPTNTSRRRKESEDIAWEGEGDDHLSPLRPLPSRPLLPEEPRTPSKGPDVAKDKKDACMPILQLLTDLKLMHSCM